MTTKPMAVVEAFYRAFGQKDFDGLRKLLADDFSFRGPLMAFDGPDAYVAGVSKMPFAGAPANSLFIADGGRVAHAFTWKMTAPAKLDVPMCEVFEVANGKIRSSVLFYDSKLLPTPN